MGLALGRGYTGGLRIAPPALHSGRYRDLGIVQGKNQREALRPTGSGLHRFGAARGGGAVGSDPLSHSGVFGGTCYAPTPALSLSLILQEYRAELWSPEPSKTSPTQQACRSWQHPSLPGQVSCVTELHHMSQWMEKPWERASKQYESYRISPWTFDLTSSG